jgi:hypothetical protein
MGTFMGSWRKRGMALLCLGYWIGLAVIILGPAGVAASIVSGAAKDTGSIGVNVSNTGLSLSIKQGAFDVWSGSISYVALVLLLAGPPLLIWVWWVARARSVALRNESRALGVTGDAALGESSEQPMTMAREHVVTGVANDRRNGAQ